ncbi:hypothetical protein EI94DRAFT_1590384, partial [Lactarius quietus]
SLMSTTRQRVLALYNELHRLGRDYPSRRKLSTDTDGHSSYDFSGRMRRMFEKNRDLKDPAEIEKALRFGEYIKNVTLALYSLRKYRHLRHA